jgi:tRNA pseudouridine38-40 synthase
MPGSSDGFVTWALEIEYDGTGFMGWQRQAHGLAVQQVVEEAGARLCGGVVPECTASGRTDAGVHARGQIVMMELPGFAPYRLKEALNYHLKPHAVAVLRAAPAPEGWNPRFSAVSRTYRYVICNRLAPLTLDAHRAWHVRPPLDAAAMNRAAALLLGHHDFSSFRAAACQAKSPWKTLDELAVRRDGELVLVHAKARSFLHHQVRNMVGTLKLVGEGAWPAARVAAALAARARAPAGPTAPAAGLYLMSVGYEVDLGLA